MAESNGLITSPPAFLMSLASPFFSQRAAGRSAVSLVSIQDKMANILINVQVLTECYCLSHICLDEAIMVCPKTDVLVRTEERIRGKIPLNSHTVSGSE